MHSYRSQQLRDWLSSLDALFPNKTRIIQHSITSTATATPMISNFVTVNSISRNQLSFHQPSSGSERVIKFPVYTVNFDLTSLIAPCWLRWGPLQTASRNISSNDFQSWVDWHTSSVQPWWKNSMQLLTSGILRMSSSLRIRQSDLRQFHKCIASERANSVTQWFDTWYKKQFHRTPMEAQGGQRIQLLLIHDLSTRLGWVVSVAPRPHFYPPGNKWYISRPIFTPYIRGWLTCKHFLTALCFVFKPPFKFTSVD
jgi:hypothetical protein